MYVIVYDSNVETSKTEFVKLSLSFRFWDEQTIIAHIKLDHCSCACIKCVCTMQHYIAVVYWIKILYTLRICVWINIYFPKLYMRTFEKKKDHDSTLQTGVKKKNHPRRECALVK